MGNVSRFGKYREFIFYCTVSIGMAISTTSFALISGVFETLSIYWVVLSILISGGLCLIMTRPIAELAGSFPAAPGIRTYLAKGFDNQIALFFVFLYIIFMILVGAVESYMFSAIVQILMPSIPSFITVLAVILIITVVNIFGWEMPRNMQIITTSSLVLGIFFLGFLAISQAPDLSAVFFKSYQETECLKLLPASIGLTMFLFVGFEWVTHLGFNPEAYEKKIARAMPIAIVINMLMYIVFCIGLAGHFSKESISVLLIPQSILAQKLMNNVGLWFALVLALFAIISTFNAGIMGGARLIYGMARENYLPKKIAYVSLETGTPIGAIVLLSSLVAIVSYFVLTYRLEIIFSIIGCSIICFVYGMLIWSLCRIRKSNKKRRTRFQTKLSSNFLYLIIALLFIFGISSLFVIEQLVLPVIFGFVFTVILALVLTYSMKQYHEKNKKKLVKKQLSS